MKLLPAFKEQISKYIISQIEIIYLRLKQLLIFYINILNLIKTNIDRKTYAQNKNTAKHTIGS